MATVLVVPAGASSIGTLDALIQSTNHELIAADIDEYAPGILRDEVTGYTVPRISNEEEYIERLEEIIRAEDVDVLIPGCDRDVAAVAKHQERLRAHVSLAMPEFETLDVAYDALSSAAVVDEAGVPVPNSYESPEELRNTESNVQFPKFVKPRTAEGGKGAHKVHDWEELSHFYSKVEREYGNPVIQEYVPGETGSMHVVGLLYNRDGNLRNSFVCHSLRTLFSWGGGGLVGEPVIREELVEYATSIIDQLGGWVGPINMEFKIHAETGEPMFIEINPRLWGYNYIATANGMNFPKRLVEICLGNDVAPQFEHDNENILIIDSVETVVEE